MLEQINNPDNLKRLSIAELQMLTNEIREFILSSVSKTGGHLASNLGLVEVTLALHYVFDFKKDKLLWDVGHQCYIHKIITGRKDKFNRLRQGDGLSGFPNPAESVYDQFITGHAGTSIATAIGIGIAQKLLGKNDKIVALIGDASIVNGVSFEALNNLALIKRQLLIVLNDNSMGIDTTQGIVAEYFAKLRLSKNYEELNKTAKNIITHLPLIGKGVGEKIGKIKKNIRMILPTSRLFESLNILYFGPVDGHDIKSLIQLFNALSKLDHPAILHVYTKKGKGYYLAEHNPSKFHSTEPFEISSGEMKSDSVLGKPNFTNVIGEHLVRLAEKDNRIIAVTSAMCNGTGLGEFRKKFRDRFYDVGIAESAAVDIAAGLAKSGLKPVVCIYSTFLQRGFDQIFQEIALQDLPIVFCIDRAGVVGPDGPTHHGLTDIGFLRIIPNLVLAAPSDEMEAKLALEFALNENKPVCLRYPKELVPDDAFDRSACTQKFQLGKGVVVKKNTNPDIAIITYGSVLTEALKASQLLEEEGIVVDVINARFAAPLDKEMVFSFTKYKGVIALEDHFLACGFGSALLELATIIFNSGIKKPIWILGAPKRLITANSRNTQLKEIGINEVMIIQKVKKMLELIK